MATIGLALSCLYLASLQVQSRNLRFVTGRCIYEMISTIPYRAMRAKGWQAWPADTDNATKKKPWNYTAIRKWLATEAEPRDPCCGRVTTKARLTCCALFYPRHQCGRRSSSQPWKNTSNGDARPLSLRRAHRDEHTHVQHRKQRSCSRRTVIPGHDFIKTRTASMGLRDH